MKKALFYLVMFFVLQSMAFVLTGVGIWLTHSGSVYDMTGQQMVAMQLVFGVLCTGFFLWRRWAEESPAFLRSHPLAVLTWSIVAAVGTLVPATWLQEHLTFLPDLVSDTMQKMVGVPLGYFVLAILTPLAEELVFRGAILRTLLAGRRSPWPAILLSALLFAAAHMNPAQMPHAFLMGILLGWLYARTRSIVPGLLVHVVNNTASYLVMAAYPDMPDLTLEQLFGGSHTSVLKALIYSFCLLLPALSQLHRHTQP